eukprot:2867717-Rhodomonas_salina.2
MGEEAGGEEDLGAWSLGGGADSLVARPARQTDRQTDSQTDRQTDRHRVSSHPLSSTFSLSALFSFL